MDILNQFRLSKLKLFLALLLSLFLLTACGIYKPVDARKIPQKCIDKANPFVKNLE